MKLAYSTTPNLERIIASMNGAKLRKKTIGARESCEAVDSGGGEDEGSEMGGLSSLCLQPGLYRVY